MSKLIIKVGTTILAGETFRSYLIFGRFWINISKDRLHFSFEYLPF